MRPRTLILLCLVQLLPISASGQNVSNYGSIPDPFLFLIREPAIYQDLRLTSSQIQQVKSLNERYDGELLATRNMQPQKAEEIITRVRSSSQQSIDQILTPDQKERLQQITYRLRGISFVLAPKATEQLELSPAQQKRIESLTAKARDEVNELQKQLFDGKATQQQTAAAVKRVQTAEQRDVLNVLTPTQQQTLIKLVGRQFDPAQLGRVAFKAPEIADSDTWINSTALKLSQLRGKVVALHFWAFG
jgi:hypothetical protein